MPTDIILILVGVALFLIAVIDHLKLKGAVLGLLNPKIRIPIGIIGLLLIIYGGYSYGAVNLLGPIEQAERGNTLQVQYPIETVQILSPIQGDSVKCRILTAGVYPEGHDHDIWVLLQPSDKKYYPQSDHTNTSYKRNGEWQVITRFGGDQGESYEIIVFETDSIASQFFSSTIEQWKQAETYPGLEYKDLPRGAVEVDRIAVNLQENCRGVH